MHATEFSIVYYNQLSPKFVTVLCPEAAVLCAIQGPVMGEPLLDIYLQAFCSVSCTSMTKSLIV